jgi:hypothetical protein
LSLSIRSASGSISKLFWSLGFGRPGAALDFIAIDTRARGLRRVLTNARLQFFAPYIFKFQSPYDVEFALEHDRENPPRFFPVRWRFSEKMMLHQKSWRADRFSPTITRLRAQNSIFQKSAVCAI